MPVPADAPAKASPEWDLFQKLLPAQLLNDLAPKAAQAVYTPFVVTWLLIYQRLHGNATLNDAVAEFALRFPPQALPECKKVRERNLSLNSGAYSSARSDLDPLVLRAAFANLYDSLIDVYPPSWRDRRAFILDGSTVQLPSTEQLRATYPPASNQNGESHWPILHLVVAHELRSGMSVLPEFGAMYGPNRRSELSLASDLVKRLPKNSILLGDRNFGIFAFAWAGVQGGHDVLARLTPVRFKALLRKGRRVRPGKWEVTWRPSRWDRQAHPELPEGAEIKGWLHEVRVSDELTLWLFTTLRGTGQEMAEFYHHRLNVETDIRDLKETLELGQLTSKGVAMVEKELVAAVLAYNLCNQVRRLAAARLGVAPRRLSFAGTWSLLKVFATGVLEGMTGEQAAAEFERLLKGAGQRILPNRPTRRSYPREAHARRRKSATRKNPKNTPTV